MAKAKTGTDYVLLSKHINADGKVLPAGSTITLTDAQAVRFVNKITPAADVDAAAAEVAQAERIVGLEGELETLQNENAELKGAVNGIGQLTEQLNLAKAAQTASAQAAQTLQNENGELLTQLKAAQAAPKAVAK